MTPGLPPQPTPRRRSHVTIALLVAGLAGCTPQPDVPAEMQRAIRGTEHALDAALLASEMFWWAEAPPTVTLRHGETCGCPCRERIGDELLLLDYALDGCVPDSGLVPDELLGHITLRPTANGFEALPDALEWEPSTTARGTARSDVGTDLKGRWGDALTLTGSLVWNDTWAEIDVAVTQGEADVTVTGSVRGPQAWVELDAMRLRLRDVQGRCPRASQGVSRVWAEREPVRLDAGGDGMLTVTWRGETSLPTDPCDVL